MALLDLFRGVLAEQFGLDLFLGRVGIKDGAEVASSLSVTNVGVHGHAVGDSVLDGSLEGLSGSEGLGRGSHKGGKGEGANDLHLD